MGANNLEQQLWKVSGQLEALIPALDKIEERLRLAENRAAGAEARFDGLRREFDEYKLKVTNRLGTLFGKAEGFAKQLGEVNGAAQDARDAKSAAATAQTTAADAKRISEELRTERKGWGKKIWDVAKMVLAALISAYITMKLTGKP